MKTIQNNVNTATEITKPAGVVIGFKNGAKHFIRDASMRIGRMVAAKYKDVEYIREFEFRADGKCYIGV